MEEVGYFAQWIHMSLNSGLWFWWKYLEWEDSRAGPTKHQPQKYKSITNQLRCKPRLLSKPFCYHVCDCLLPRLGLFGSILRDATCARKFETQLEDGVLERPTEPMVISELAVTNYWLFNPKLEEIWHKAEGNPGLSSGTCILFLTRFYSLVFPIPLTFRDMPSLHQLKAQWLPCYEKAAFRVLWEKEDGGGPNDDSQDKLIP